MFAELLWFSQCEMSEYHINDLLFTSEKRFSWILFVLIHKNVLVCIINDFTTEHLPFLISSQPNNC